MTGTRQSIQLELAFPERGRGEDPSASGGGAEPATAGGRSESPARGEQLMEEVCQREYLKRALKRVQQNRGSPGVDGMTVEALADYLRERWPAIREQLLGGTYRPEPVKRVEIPKPGGEVCQHRIARTLSVFDP